MVFRTPHNCLGCAWHRNSRERNQPSGHTDSGNTDSRAHLASFPTCHSSHCCQSCIWRRCMRLDTPDPLNSVSGILLEGRRTSSAQPMPFRRSVKYRIGMWGCQRSICSAKCRVECRRNWQAATASVSTALEPSNAFRADPHNQSGKSLYSQVAAEWSDSTSG